jgi:hypothetical protein
MKERPRSFAWFNQFGTAVPQILFDDPRIGSIDIKPVVERKLDPSEFHLTLDEVAAKYPAPMMGDA